MMTAKTHVHEQVAEVSTNSKPSVEIQGDQCALDVSSYQDFSKLPAPDCNGNGISHRDDNGISRDDVEDNSYVFVSGKNDLMHIDNCPKVNAQVSDDSEGVEVQNREFLNSSSPGVDSSWVFEGTEVASSNNFSAEKSDADAIQVAVTGDAAQQNVRAESLHYMRLEHHQNDPKSSLAAEEIQESKAEVLELGPGLANKDQPEISLDIAESTDVNQESQEKNNFESTSGLGEGGEPYHANLEATLCKSSQVGVLGSDADSVGKPKPLETGVDIAESTDVNKKSREENLESRCESGEGGESQNAGFDVTSNESAEVEISKGNDSPQNFELSEAGTQDFQQNYVVDFEHKTEKSVDEVELQLGTETECSPVLDEIKYPESAFNASVPETEASVELIDNSERSLQLQQYSESTDNLNPVVDADIGQGPVESDENVLFIAREHEADNNASSSIENIPAKNQEIIKPETGDAFDIVVESVENALDLPGEHGSEHMASCLAENDASTLKVVNEEETVVDNFAGGDGASCSPKKVFTSLEFDPEVSPFQVNDVHLKTEVSIMNVDTIDLQSVPSRAEKEFEVGSSSVISSGDMPCNDVFDSSLIKDKLRNCMLDNVDVESKGGHLSGERLISDDQLTRQDTKNLENSPSNSKPSIGAMAGQDVVGPLTRPFHFLIRMPRFEDLKMKEQIVKAQLLVEEKTQHRDAFRIEVQKYKANCLGYAAEYEAAVSESRALKRSVKAKRAEIDSLQSMINKVKNAISVDDIDTRIHSMEHMIEHETLPLKEEKLLIREIKQLKQLREQLSSNIGSQDEVQQALNNRDQIEERLKVLKKELDGLKDSVLKADAVARALEKKYEDENKKVKEVQTQYAAANNVRQDAYAHLQSLRRQLFEKNQHFRMYKENAAAASNYAVNRDRDPLHHLCINQVESLMELWNKNDEFRKDYVRCNMKSTLRRLGTLDGRSIGPDEQPPVFTSFANERVNRLVSNPVNSGPLLQTQNLEQEVVKPVQCVSVGDKTKVDELDVTSPTTMPKKQEQPVLGNGFAAVLGSEITDKTRSEQYVPTEELELARKVEELRKEEAAAKLKEQRRLEERAKALEALERKKRNAEKALMRAELRAQKEAEQREKEREKRLRKKERKKASTTEVPEGNNSVETTPNCESSTETMKEPEIKENPAAASKRIQKPLQFTKQSKAKSIPPPLRNKSRRKLQQWMWIILTCLLVVALFLLGNVGLFSNLPSLRRRNSGF